MPESDNLNTRLLTEDEQAIYNAPATAVKSFSAVGYDAYGATTDHKNWQNLPMPTWAELPEKQRTAWNAATAAIVGSYVSRLDVGMLNYAIAKNNAVNANEVSDGFHTFGELYDHRITLFIALCKVLVQVSGHNDENVWRSRRHSDGELAYGGGCFVLGIGIAEGQQITYHLPDSRWDECAFAEEFRVAPEWDKHSSIDVLERLKAL